jgi:adenylate cyclase
MFEQAIALDPQFATAYAELGWVFFEQWVMGWSQDAQILDQTLAMAQRVLALDGAVADGHRLVAVVYLWKKQYEQAIAEAERAITLDPNSADGYANLAHILNFAGQSAETATVMQTAMRLNPQYPVWYVWELGHTYYLTGRYEEAIATMKRILARNPEFLPAQEYLAVIYSELGREEEARAAGAECLRLHPNLPLKVIAQRLPYKDPAVLERVLNAARKAGLR